MAFLDKGISISIGGWEGEVLDLTPPTPKVESIPTNRGEFAPAIIGSNNLVVHLKAKEGQSIRVGDLIGMNAQECAVKFNEEEDLTQWNFDGFVQSIEENPWGYFTLEIGVAGMMSICGLEEETRITVLELLRRLRALIEEEVEGVSYMEELSQIHKRLDEEEEE